MQRQILQLRHVLSAISGSTPASSEDMYWDGNIPWVTPEDVGRIETGYRLQETRRNITREGYASCGTTIVPKGSLVLTKRAPIGQLAVLDIDACSNQGCLLLTTKESADSRFVYYLLFEKSSWLQVLGRGSTFMELSVDDLKSLHVSLPLLDEQRTIADFLDRETAKIDALIVAKEKLLGILAEKRRALISHAVTRGLNPDAPSRDSGIPWLGKTPAHWAIPPVYARFDVQLGKMLDEKRIKGTHLAPYLRNVDVQWSSVNTEDLPVMDFDEQDRVKYSLKKDDILVCEGGEIGRCALWQGDIKDCYYQKALHRLRPMHKKDDPQFFQFVMRTLVDAGIFSSEALASTIQHLPAEKLRVLRYPSPPLHEQHAIVTYIKQETTKLDAMRDATEKTIGLLKERRAALIAAAVMGEMNIAEQ